MKREIEIFINNITDSDYGQSGVCYFSKDRYDVDYLTALGWRAIKYKNIYRLTPPRTTLADLVSCRKIKENKDPVLNYCFFVYLKSLARTGKLEQYIYAVLQKEQQLYDNLVFHLSTGVALEAEIVMYGSDSRIHDLRRSLFSDFTNKVSHFKSGVQNISEITARRQLVKRVYSDEFSELTLFSDSNEQENGVFKQNKKLGGCGYSVSLDTIKNLEYDVILFVAQGCFDFILDYVDWNDVHKIMLWEYHQWIANLDSADDRYTGTVSNRKELKNKRVLIVDRVYSGSTLLSVKALVKEAGGIPITLAVEPKSTEVLYLFDYVQIIDTVYDVNALDVEDPMLFDKIYFDTFGINLFHYRERLI